MIVYAFTGKVKELLTDLRKFIERRESECEQVRA